MKLINGKLAAAVLALGSVSSVMAVTPVNTVYKFQFDSGVAGFTPSYIWVSGLALNTPMSIDQAIQKFTIKTPQGTWTAGQFSPVTPPVGVTIGSSPFWATLGNGSLPQVEIVNGGNTLIFLQTAQLEVPFTSTVNVASVGTTVNGDYNLVLTSTHISDTFTSPQSPTLQDDVNTGANGQWDNSNPIRTTNTPEVAGTAWLLLGAFGILGAFQYAQRRSVSTNA